jgi:hypothetical protein
MSNVAWLIAVPIVVLFVTPVAGQVKPNLSGTWQLDASKSEFHNGKIDSATWVIDERNNSIRISETEKGKTIEVQCTTDGKDCKTGGDNKATTSFWYNGPMLVEFETKGDLVTRYRMTLSEDGKTLKAETTSIVPQNNQMDVLVFKKQG